MTRRINLATLISCLIIALNGNAQSLFQSLSSEETGISFENVLTETEEFNFFHFDYFYNGGGVAVGDINNDGLQDIFFTGNQVHDQLYLNTGDLTFENISDQAGIKDDKGWHTGVIMLDINADGWLDIYVCRSGSADTKSELTNLLYLNQQDGKFVECAALFGVDDNGRSVHATFFDHDLDGDLDLFIINHPKNISMLTVDKSYELGANRLYENQDGKFIDVTLNAGLGKYSYSLGVAVSDINNDGWTDLYVSNDFQTADF
ncbi:MAG: VCBS repeat-containing protein, partial [Crocinitomicaceae bacterium]|nr:VCBS repeat-containing protein [Crocinitomicaceae bacterium]